MRKQLLQVLLWVAITIGAIAVTGFAVNRHAARQCSNVAITIERQPQANDQLFMTADDVRGWMRERGDSLVGTSLNKLSIPDLENWLNTLPAVQSAEAFISVNCEVSINLLQRRPICRIITRSNESYYLDDRGVPMPWMAEYTAAVTPVTGAITESYGRMYQRNFSLISIDSAVRTPLLIDDIWHLCKVIDNDTLLRSQIAQVYIADDRTFELVPRVGNHRILLGSVADLDEKFAKLRVFYREGLRYTGSWESYSIIDLQYRHQIVCTKKSLANGS